MLEYEYPGAESMIINCYGGEYDQCLGCPFANAGACKNQCTRETEIYNPILSQIAAKQNRRSKYETH